MRLSPALISGMNFCAITGRFSLSVSVSMTTRRLGSSRRTRKMLMPPMPSSFLNTTSPCSAWKSISSALRDATISGGVHAAKRVAKNFSLQSRKARGAFTTSAPCSAARSSR